MTLKKISKLLGTLTLATCALNANASLSLIGDDLIYGGGSLNFQNMPASSAYQNRIWLDKDVPDIFNNQFLFFDNTSESRSFTEAQLASFGITPGEELVFFITNPHPPFGYLSNGRQAQITSLGSSLFQIGFEDTLLRNSDKDFNDAVVRVSSVPEPGSLALLGLGLASLALARRRRNADR